MRFNLSDKSQTLSLVAAFMALGYEACGGTVGLGALQATDGVNASNILDLTPPRPSYGKDGSKEVYGDYVAGRMMKTGIVFNEAEGWVEVRDSKPTPDYQGWCEGQARDPGVAQAQMLAAMFGRMGDGRKPTKYASYEALLQAAAKSIGVEITNANAAAV